MALVPPPPPPWYRDAGRVLAAGYYIGCALTAALAVWACAAGTWRAVHTPGITSSLLASASYSSSLVLVGGAAFFALGALAAVTLIVLAAGLIGGGLGFLFALPRMEPHGNTPPVAAPPAAESQPAPAAAAPAAGPQPAAGNAGTFRPSTALTEIADWLTKIIVGVGLVQATAIGQGFHAVMTFILNTGGLGRFPAAGLVVPACMLIGLIGGFVVVYLGMTLAISSEIASAAYALETQRERELWKQLVESKAQAVKADQEKQEAEEARQLADQDKQAAEEATKQAAKGEVAALEGKALAEKGNVMEAARAAAEVEQEALARAQVVDKWRREDVRRMIRPFGEQQPIVLSDAEQSFVDQPLEQCRTIDERRAWAKLNVALKRRQQALTAYQALLDDPNMKDFNIAQEAHLLAVANQDLTTAVAFTGRARELAADQPNAVSPASRQYLELDEVNAALYEAAPGGFQKALTLLDDLAGRMPDVLNSGPYHVYRAATLGQRYAHLVGQPTRDPAAEDAIVAEAEAEIRQARTLGEGDWLTYLATPAPTASDGTVAPVDDDLVELAKRSSIRAALGLS